MTGVDDVDDWSDWDEAETGSVAESGTSSGRDSGSGDTYGETGDTGWEESSEWETESRQEEPTGTENRANAANTEVMNQADTGGSVRKDQIQAGSLDSMDMERHISEAQKLIIRRWQKYRLTRRFPHHLRR